ncbi:MAG: RNA 2',3'-cyclic phosphodiesterase [Aigarchaeota archaeon]|nr:RNA 2',3'-cyclic phosphodiesterase [Aigarchaeota archaeon]MCX8193290.1 RNA 2',3'-cyclic phosphodiesterase [Nitrososphaeria archaeon]MDW7986509.1 RNA 2',3'-cyclic phosphodiesterase [Nitrososphaerota archaeon]
MAQLTRTFIAVDFDNPLIVSRVQDIQKELRESGIIAKDVEPENLHLTIWFLGELTEDKLKILLEEVNKIYFKEFELRIRGLGYFPGGNRINVIWLGVEDPENMLKNILEQLLNYLGKKGFKYDERGFTPHLTIARVKYIQDKQRALKIIQSLKYVEVGTQLISSVKVKKSILTSKGPIYSDLVVVEAGKKS